MEYFFGEAWWKQRGAWLGPFVRLTAGGYALVLLGVYTSVRDMWHGVRTRAPRDLRFLVKTFLLSSLALHALLCVTQALAVHPHYYNAIWPVAFLFGWIAASDLRERRWFRAYYLLHAGCLTVVLVALTFSLHRTSGNRLLGFGPSLGTQWALARELERLPKQGATVLIGSVPTVHRFPHALGTLQRLARARGTSGPPLPAGTYAIVFRHPEQNENGELALHTLALSTR